MKVRDLRPQETKLRYAMMKAQVPVIRSPAGHVHKVRVFFVTRAAPLHVVASSLFGAHHREAHPCTSSRKHESEEDVNKIAMISQATHYALGSLKIMNSNDGAYREDGGYSECDSSGPAH